MKNIFLGSLVAGSLMFFASSMSASDCNSIVSVVKSETSAKCGAGKCGDGKVEKSTKCGAGKCGDGKVEKSTKCGAGKCGSGKAEPKVKESAGKCGDGKCGGGK